MDASFEVGDGEQCMESIGMFDHEGIRRFAHEYAEKAGGGKELTPASCLIAGFYLGAAWTQAHQE